MRRTITDIDRYIGQRIREARIAAKLSQDDLGNMLGVSYQQIQKYESGQSRIAGVHFGRLVSALNRPMPWFFPNSTEVRMPPTLNAMLASKTGQRVATGWPYLTPAWQTWVADTVEMLAKEES